MRKKRWISVILVLCMMTSIALIGGFRMRAAEGKAGAASDLTKKDGEYRYFYDQLSDTARIFYDGMYRMYIDGIFKTGTGSLDLSLIENGLTQEQIAAHLSGSINLLAEYGAARDAFYADYPDIFYVDFSNLSIRATREKNGTCHLYLGPGRYKTYYTEGFTCKEDVDQALTEYDQAIHTVLEAAGEGSTISQIRNVHEYITHHTSYRLENACAPENVGFIRTAYGALVKGEGVCEAYTRAFKAAMDRLGIPCVMISGVYRHTEDMPELHIWNAVQIDGKWYGVDVTMDDPVGKTSENGVDGYECTQYLLAGQSVMNNRHAPSGVMSEANYEFTYPELEWEPYDNSAIIAADNGLEVRYEKDGIYEDVSAGIFYISYNGKGANALKEDGLYFLLRYYSINSQTGEWEYSPWCYVLPDIFDLEDTGTEVILPMPHIRYAEFGVTDIPPGPYNDPSLMDKQLIYEYTTFHGNPFLLVADSGMLYNPNSNYVAPPYVKKITPGVTGSLMIGEGSYHIVATYDDNLVRLSDDIEPGITFICDTVRMTSAANTGEIYSSLSGFQWNGTDTIEFDFTPSEMWSDDSVFYTFSVTGLVGEKSGKEPNSITYLAEHRCTVYAYQSQGFDFNVFGKPTLLDHSDISTNDWKTSDGESVAESLKHRMVLVASRPTNAEIDELEEKLDQNGIAPLACETYNINLTVCKKQVINTGDGVRVSLGFPEGYGPEDEGVTFKAYHFIKDEYGNVAGVEEIPCLITKYGLVITCTSFSPFAIAAVEGERSTDKTLILTSDVGGAVTSPQDSDGDGMVTLHEGESAAIQIKADKDYVIDSVIMDEQYLTVENENSMEITLDYDDLAENGVFLKASFLVASIAEEELGDSGDIVPSATPGDANTKEPEEGSENPEITIEKVELNPTVVRLTEGDRLVITASVLPEDRSYQYQWYKDDAAIEMQTEQTLVMDAVTVGDTGQYKLKVTAGTGSAMTEQYSDLCVVTVNEKAEETTESAEAPEDKKPGVTSESAGSTEDIVSPIPKQPDGGSPGTEPDNSGQAETQKIASKPATGDGVFLTAAWMMLLFAGLGVVAALSAEKRKK